LCETLLSPRSSAQLSTWLFCGCLTVRKTRILSVFFATLQGHSGSSLVGMMHLRNQLHSLRLRNLKSTAPAAVCRVLIATYSSIRLHSMLAQCYMVSRLRIKSLAAYYVAVLTPPPVPLKCSGQRHQYTSLIVNTSFTPSMKKIATHVAIPERSTRSAKEFGSTYRP
jgi:hypothetical protein